MANGVPRPGIWQAEVFSRIDELRGRLQAAQARRHWWPRRAAAEEAVHAAVATSLETAETAARTRTSRSHLKAWWTGSAITEAWEGVHHAELGLIGIERRASVEAILARLLAWTQTTIENPDRRAHHEEVLWGQIEHRRRFNRVQVRQVFVDVIAANRERYANLRTFRNILIVVTGMLILLITGVVAWHVANPSFLPICPKKAHRCLKGPASADVAIVVLLGAIGGSLGLAFGLTKSDAAPSRYDPKAWQAFLKPVTGAITGLLGVVLIQAEFLVSPVTNKGYALFIYAFAFGFSQQLLTRTVDKQAEALVKPANV